MRSYAVGLVLAASSVLLGHAGIQLDRKMAPKPQAVLSMHELIALRRLDAHVAAVRQNATAKEWCPLEQAVRPMSFGGLFGEWPATMGSVFEIDDWGRAHTTDERFPVRGSARRNLSFVDARVVVSRASEPWCREGNDDPEVYCPFLCQPDVRSDCMVLGWQLHAAWAESSSWETWHDPVNQIRATVRQDRGDGDCELRFHRYVPVKQWIAWTTTAEIPLGLLGGSVKRLPAYAEQTYSGREWLDRYEWPLAVAGAHIAKASISAFVRHGRIVRFQVDGEMDLYGGADELYALMQPFRRAPLTVTTTQYGKFTLEIGEPPPTD